VLPGGPLWARLRTGAASVLESVGRGWKCVTESLAYLNTVYRSVRRLDDGRKFEI
jgi:hypothetical protein